MRTRKKTNKTINKYKCSKCDKIVERESTKQWIKSYCDRTHQYTRIMLIKK